MLDIKGASYLVEAWGQKYTIEGARQFFDFF
jgi:hypothetical protein